MLSYNHIFHAGNHADILKHSVLANILESLNSKDKPYTIIDTHAGNSFYDLSDKRNLQTNESQKGIIELLGKISSHERTPREIPLPDSLSNYIKIATIYKQKNLYPGSVELERIFTKENCAHIVNDFNNTEFAVLQQNLKSKPLYLINQKNCKTQVFNQDALKLINSITPPLIKRGLCIIDPSFETKTEYKDITEFVIKLHKRWNVAIIALWYPLLNHKIIEIEKMKSAITSSIKSLSPNTSIMDARLCVYREDSHIEKSLEEVKLDRRHAGDDRNIKCENHDASGDGNGCINEHVGDENIPRLYGSGMLVINSPYLLEQKTSDNLEFICNKIYSNENPRFSVEVL